MIFEPIFQSLIKDINKCAECEKQNEKIIEDMKNEITKKNKTINELKRSLQSAENKVIRRNYIRNKKSFCVNRKSRRERLNTL